MLNNPFVLPSYGKGKLFIISAPSGTGKTTIAELLVQRLTPLTRVLTTTTRAPRKNEKAGVDYRFVTSQQFQTMKANHDFLETVELYGYQYGTEKQEVAKSIDQGRHALLVIDTQGAKKVSDLIPESICIFLKPPSHDELKKRLHGRGSENEHSLLERMKRAERELLDESYFQYSVLSDDLERVYQAVSSILIAECHRLPKGVL